MRRSPRFAPYSRDPPLAPRPAVPSAPPSTPTSTMTTEETPRSASPPRIQRERPSSFQSRLVMSNEDVLRMNSNAERAFTVHTTVIDVPQKMTWGALRLFHSYMMRNVQWLCTTSAYNVKNKICFKIVDPENDPFSRGQHISLDSVPFLLELKETYDVEEIGRLSLKIENAIHTLQSLNNDGHAVLSLSAHETVASLFSLSYDQLDRATQDFLTNLIDRREQTRRPSNASRPTSDSRSNSTTTFTGRLDQFADQERREFLDIIREVRNGDHQERRTDQTGQTSENASSLASVYRFGSNGVYVNAERLPSETRERLRVLVQRFQDRVQATRSEDYSTNVVTSEQIEASLERCHLEWSKRERPDVEEERTVQMTTLMCPITQEVFKDPVVAADGHSYERSAILRWFENGKTRSPVTNQTLDTKNVITNHTLRAMLDKMQ